MSKGSILVVRSVTSAIKGQKLLESHGIYATVQRNTSPNLGQGCGYGLKIKGDPQEALQFLAGADIKVVEVQI